MNPMMFPFVIYQRWLQVIFSCVKTPEKEATVKLVPKPTPYEG